MTRDPPSPRPILDRPALIEALELNGIVLKPGQIDSFYQQLHRSGYPPLGEFVSERLRGNNALHGVENASVGTSRQNFATKNSISSRPGRKAMLPKSFLSYLSGGDFATLTSKVQVQRTSADGTTTKLMVELHDGHVVESVLMRHGGRVTICVSSQVGCAMGCTFCATGTMGIRGNLSSGEILEQLVHGSRVLASSGGGGGDKEGDSESRSPKSEAPTGQKRGKKQGSGNIIRNVVFMGMGEPLNNYRQVLAACRAMIDRRSWNLAHNRVTVSTVGVPSRMRDLTQDLPEVNLALSLHAPNQATREKIVPAARGTPVESLIEALDDHMMALSKRRILSGNPQGSDQDGGTEGTQGGYAEEERYVASKKRRAMIEYVMLEGDTSTIEAAHQLGKLCEGRHLVVNLIPYNKTDVKDELSCPSEEHMMEFRRIVSSYGSFCSIRRTMGADIAGACGQLVVEGEKKKQARGVADIEDGPFVGGGGDGRGRRAVAVRPRRGKEAADDPGDEGGCENGFEDVWMRRLTLATAIAASCFAVSGTLLVMQRRKR